jgi:uncharacterized protein YdhG (YjbR/CyaY superfamily)
MAPSTVDEYLDSVSPASIEKLTRLRTIVLEEIPDGAETISYGIPSVKKGKVVVHFAGYRSHVGFYPGANVMAEYESRLQSYKRAKGSVQFPLDDPLPESLIRDMIRSRLKAAG